MPTAIEKTLGEFTEKVGGKVKTLEDDLAVVKGTVDKIDKVMRQPQRGDISFAVADRKEVGQWGYKSLNHQLREIRDATLAAKSGDTSRVQKLNEIQTKGLEEYHKHDPTFVQKAAQGLGEGVGPDGGFLLAPTYAEGVLEIMHAEENLLDRTDKYEMAGPSIKIRAIDETSRVTGSRWGGVQAYWVDEGASLTPSKPRFRMIEMTPHKLATLFYASDELLADGGAMLEQMTSRLMAKEINFTVGIALVRGTGAGQPLGILNAACTVSVAKDVGQAATTITTNNVQNMWSRLHSSARANACWFIHQDCEPSMNQMTLPVGIGGVPTYLPPGGVSEKPYGSLLGRPVIVTEFNSTLGTVGDIILVDMKAIISATRGTIQAASSMHVAFLTDEMAYRLTFRVDAQPWWATALTPFLGTNTQTPMVTLATRS